MRKIVKNYNKHEQMDYGISEFTLKEEMQSSENW